MKRLFLSIVALVLAGSAYADEGMWLLPYLQRMNIGNMQSKGCKLSAEEIYSAEQSSLKDAIVLFGRGCTGEIVSQEGLLLTNHHCGYGSIQALSSVENDYLKHGFWAMSDEEELPVPGLEVRFVRHIVDVTEAILGNVPSLAKERERAELVKQNIEKQSKQLKKQFPNMEIKIREFFGGNSYVAFAMEVFLDVRLVGTPPESVGNFGGDTDNWMWPRHTCDFSVFRVYADKENKPAPYSRRNRPYKAEKYLKVSLDGYRDGDFGMIMGFPGKTDRYMTSYEIDQLVNVTNPQLIFIRSERQRLLKEDMNASNRVHIQYASKYAQSSNHWKNAIGKTRGVAKLNVKAQKQLQEDTFQQWADKNTLPEEGFIDALPKICDAVRELTPLEGTLQYYKETLLSSIELMTPATYLNKLLKIKQEDEREKYSALVRRKLIDFYEDYNVETDRKVAKQMLRIIQGNMSELPALFGDITRDFGADTDAYIDHLFDHTIVTNPAQMMAFLDSPSTKGVENDPALALGRSVMEDVWNLQAKIAPIRQKLSEGQRLYIAGLMRMQPDKAWYPDANFSPRLTYGQILPYEPADGIVYRSYTTLGGVIAKDNPKNRDFMVPEQLKELHRVGDYGRYADADGTLHTAFLANCDITGGNSGSPILNARGELIGLAFDGNWEAMSGDIAFEPNMQRTISVDIRYVLFIIDKFAGCTRLLEEMEIVQQPI